MKELFQKFTENIETNIILTAAQMNGWEIKILVNGKSPLSEIQKNGLKYRIYEGKFSVNTSISTKISNNKFLTQTLLKDFFPFITGAQLFKITDLNDTLYEELLRKNPKRVVKPVDENNGLGVTTGLKDIASLRKAVEKVKNLHSSSVLIENHIETLSEFRIILWKGKVLDILQRIPAYIIGDGTHTVEQLIREKNKKRFDNFGDVFEPIIIDEGVLTLLEKKNMNLQSIAEKNEYIHVKTTCNLSQGGEVKRIDISQIHPEYFDIFEKIYTATWMNYCGADLITHDITQAPEVGKTAINELNGGPGITLAFFDDVATNRMFYGVSKILKMMEKDPVQMF